MKSTNIAMILILGFLICIAAQDIDDPSESAFSLQNLLAGSQVYDKVNEYNLAARANCELDWDDSVIDCDFSLDHHPPSGEKKTLKCKSQFNLTEVELSVSAVAARNNKMVVIYLGKDEDESIFHFHVRIVDMMSCEFKEAKPLEFSFKELDEKVLAKMMVTLLSNKLAVVQAFYNDDDTVDVFLPLLKSCEGGVCRMRYSLSGETIEGPTPYFPKNNKTSIFMYTMYPISSGNYVVRATDLHTSFINKLKGDQINSNVRLLYVNANRHVSDVYTTTYEKNEYFTLDASKTGFAFCHSKKEQNAKLNCSQYSSTGSKMSEALLDLSNSVNPLGVFIVKPYGGFFLITGQRKGESAYKSSYDNLRLQYVKPTGEKGFAMEIPDLNCSSDEITANYLIPSNYLVWILARGGFVGSALSVSFEEHTTCITVACRKEMVTPKMLRKCFPTTMFM